MKLSEEKSTEEEIEGMKELGNFFSVEGVRLEGIVSNSFIKKLQKEMGEEIKVMGLFLTAPKSKDMVFILDHPKEEEKSLLISTKKSAAEKFYKAMSTLKKGKK